ncbi:MAG: hypothetical protein LUH21_14015 [Clostridiales bacterium]|nr:hypothetical protein [Clostridiales bacterium]
MLETMNDIPNSNEAFARYFLKWLGLEHIYEQSHWLGKTPETVNNDLISLIESYAYSKISEDQFTEFKQKFQILYNNLYPRTSLRNDRLPHLKKLNEKFNELNLPYIVSNIGNTTYMIRKG